MIYDHLEVKHSFNVIYKEEEHDVRFGILLSAMQDPYHKGILSGLSISQNTEGFRIDGGTFAYNGYIVQMFRPILFPFPEIQNNPRPPLPPITTTPPSVIPPDHNIEEYPPGYEPPDSIIGGGGEHPPKPGEEEKPTTTTTYRIKPAMSVRICPDMETGEYGVVTKSSFKYLDKDLNTKSDDIDFTDTYSVIDNLTFNKKCVRFKYISPNRIRITEARRVYDNSTVNMEDLTIKVESNFIFRHRILNIETTPHEDLDLREGSIRVTNNDELDEKKNAIVSTADVSYNNSKIESTLHPYINSEVIITLDSSRTLIGFAVDDQGNVYINNWYDYANNQTIMSYSNNRAATIFYDENLIIDYRGLSPLNEFKVLNVDTVTVEEMQSPDFNRIVKAEQYVEFQNEIDDKSIFIPEEDKEDENSDFDFELNEFNPVNKYLQEVGFFEHMAISRVLKVIDSKVKQKYYHLQVMKNASVWTRGIKGIQIEDTSIFNSVLDESFIGYSYSFNGMDNWLYVNNVNSQIILRFPTYDPVLSAPISASILNVLFNSTGLIYPYNIGYRKILDVSEDIYASNMSNDFIKELNNLNIMIIQDDNNARPGDVDGDGKIDVDMFDKIGKVEGEDSINEDKNTETITPGDVNNSNSSEADNLLEGLGGITGNSNTTGTNNKNNQYSNNDNVLNVKVPSLSVEELNRLIAEGLLQSGNIAVFNKIVFTLVYYHHANKIQFFIKDAFDLTPQDCIIGTLVTPTRTSYYLTYRDYEYPRMMPYAEWNQADTIVYASSFIPSFGNFIPTIKLDKVDKDKINPGTTDPDAPDSWEEVDPEDDVTIPDENVVDNYMFEINKVSTPTIDNIITYSGTGTNGLEVHIVDYQGNEYVTTIEDGKWEYKSDYILPDGLYITVFKVYDLKDGSEEPMLVATGRSNAFRIDTVASIALNFIKNSATGIITISGEVEEGAHLKFFLVKSSSERELLGEQDPLKKKFEFKNEYAIMDGEYTVIVECVDPLGNIKLVESNSFIIDSTIPDIDDTEIEERPDIDESGESEFPAAITKEELVTATLTQYVETNLIAKTLIHDFDKILTIADFDAKSDDYITDGTINKYYIGLNAKQTVEFTFIIPETYSTFMVVPSLFGTTSDYAYVLFANNQEIMSNYEIHSTFLNDERKIKIKLVSRANKFILLGIGLAYNTKSRVFNDTLRINHLRERSLPILEYVFLEDFYFEKSDYENNEIIQLKTSYRSYDINGENCTISIYMNDNTYLYHSTEKSLNNIVLDIPSDDIKEEHAVLVNEDSKRKYYEYPIKYVVSNSNGSNVYYQFMKYTIIKHIEKQGEILDIKVISKAYTESEHQVVLVTELKYDGIEPVTLKYYGMSMLPFPSFTDEIYGNVSIFHYNFALALGSTEAKVELYNKQGRMLDMKLIEIEH